MSRRRKVLVWSGVALLALAAALAAFAWLRSGDVEAAARELPRPCACEVVSNAMERLERTFGVGRGGVEAVRLDVRGMSCGELRKALEGRYETGTATLWMPGENDWLILWNRQGGTVQLAELMARFEDEDGDDSVVGLFASYVGELKDVLPAFAGLGAEDAVVPELFVTKVIPEIPWLGFEGVDEDILRSVRSELLRVQAVRRMVLEGCMFSRQGKTEQALDKWAEAERHHARDHMIRERLQILSLNAKVFVKVGKYGMAANCYEAILCIEPADYAATVNLATCLENLGKKDYAKKVFDRASSLRAAQDRRNAAIERKGGPGVD